MDHFYIPHKQLRGLKKNSPAICALLDTQRKVKSSLCVTLRAKESLSGTYLNAPILKEIYNGSNESVQSSKSLINKILRLFSVLTFSITSFIL